MIITEALIDSLLSNTDPLFLNVYTFQCSGHSMPGKSHLGAAIAHQDVVERRQDFILELKNTMCSWVYSKVKYQQIFETELAARKQDRQNASAHIQAMVNEKFRKGFPQGQFGELLLFNFIQHIFKAVPVLRKMSITTNPAIERHGADAIHYRKTSGENVIYLGEAKSYSSAYKFRSALEESVDSIVSTLNNFSNELGLYVYEDFIDEALRDVAYKIKVNSLPNVSFELVCVVSYTETSKKDGATQSEIYTNIRNIVNSKLEKNENLLNAKSQIALKKIHFVVIPFWKFDDILKEFES